MYKAFEISLGINSLPFRKDINGRIVSDFPNLCASGVSRLESQRQSIQKELLTYIRADGRIDGKMMIKDWFPTIESHVFLSHSHSDEALAIAFSQWLYDNYKINTFIDSTVWGYADKLLEEIDNVFARISGNDGKNRYSYSLRNRTTAFVHNLLSASLSNMIDKCECLMFLNTPNSIIPDPYKEETSSPWIFYELQQSAVIRQHRGRTRYFSDGGIIAEAREFKVALPAQTSHLIKLGGKQLLEWSRAAVTKGYQENPTRALDLLYNLTR